MGLGGTAKKLQKVVDAADELYARINDLKDDITAVRDSIDETNRRVSNIEDELAAQRELLERIAEAEGVDPAIERKPEQTADSEPSDSEPTGSEPAGSDPSGSEPAADGTE